MKLPGISDADRLRVKTRGTFLQTKTLIKTGHLSWKSYPFLIPRGFGLLKRMIQVKL